MSFEVFRQSPVQIFTLFIPVKKNNNPVESPEDIVAKIIEAFSIMERDDAAGESEDPQGGCVLFPFDDDRYLFVHLVEMFDYLS